MCSNLEVEDQQSKMQMNGASAMATGAPLYVVNITYLVGYYSGLVAGLVGKELGAQRGYTKTFVCVVRLFSI